MKKKLIKISALLMAFVIAGAPVAALADSSYTYNYDYWEEYQESPEGNKPEKEFLFITKGDIYSHIIYHFEGIENKDNYDSLKLCIDSIIKKTKGVDYEIIVVDNGSNDINKPLIEEYLKCNNCKYIYFKHRKI